MEGCTCPHRYTVRSWCEEDGLGIDRLVRRVQEVGAGGGTVINPEGVYTEDCLSARQTYTNEGGAFLVVVDTTGTAHSFPRSPARHSTPTATGDDAQAAQAPMNWLQLIIALPSGVVHTAVPSHACPHAWGRHHPPRTATPLTLPLTYTTGTEERVVACAGLLLGTEVSYFDGGESMADPDRPCVAAVRRLVVDCKRVPEVSVQDGLQAFLLGILETLAAHAAAELMMAANVDLIALGCVVARCSCAASVNSGLFARGGGVCCVWRGTHRGRTIIVAPFSSVAACVVRCGILGTSVGWWCAHPQSEPSCMLTSVVLMHRFSCVSTCVQVWAGKRGARATKRAAADDSLAVERVRSHATIEVPARTVRVHGDGEACAGGGGGGASGAGGGWAAGAAGAEQRRW
jgi:hypothetical protein